MDDYPEQPSRSKIFFSWLFLLSPVIIGFIFLIKPISTIFEFSWQLLKWILGGEFPLAYINQDLFKNVVLIIVSLLFFILCVFLINPFILPVKSRQDLKRTWDYFWKFIFRIHGKPIIIKEGKIINNLSRRDHHKPTVIVSDLNSGFIIKFKDKDQKHSYHRESKPFVSSTGIVFTRKGESIDGSVDLRPQIRYLDTKGQTKDGIELQTRIYVVFSVGEVPEELYLTSVGDKESDLRIIEIGEKYEKDEKGIYARKVIKNIKASTELESEDRREIFSFYKQFLKSMETSEPDWQSGGIKRGDDSYNPPYNLDHDRIQAAISASSKILTGIEAKEWHELPVIVASDIFRKLITKFNFDDLYLPENPEKFPLHAFRKIFHNDVRNQGVINFRIIIPKTQQPPEVGDCIEDGNYIISPVQQLNFPKTLRKAGIKIIAAGFSELIPDESVRKRILEYWEARGEGGIIEVEQPDEQGLKQVKERFPSTSQKLAEKPVQKVESPAFYENDMVSKLIHDIDEAVADSEVGNLLTFETKRILWELRQILLSLRENQQKGDQEPSANPSIQI